MAVMAPTAAPSVPSELDDGVWYPYVEGGEPVVQGNWHFATVREAVNMITGLLRGKPEAGIFSDILVYYEKDDPSKRLVPDLLVLPAVDAPERERRHLRLWREASHPVFVMEVLSTTTAHEDYGRKYQVYQDEMRVPEYFLCDPAAPVRVWAYRLRNGVYEPVDANDDGRVWSESLNAWFGVDANGHLQVWNAAGEPLPRYDAAIRRAEAAEARVRELEEELRRRG